MKPIFLDNFMPSGMDVAKIGMDSFLSLNYSWKIDKLIKLCNKLNSYEWKILIIIYNGLYY